MFLKYLIKPLCRTLYFFFIFIVLVKIYYYSFIFLYILIYELYYDITPIQEFIFITVISVYLRFLLTLILRFETNKMFFLVILWYNNLLIIRRFGFWYFVNTRITSTVVYKLSFMRKYWIFRLKISPLRASLFFLFRSVFYKHSNQCAWLGRKPKFTTNINSKKSTTVKDNKYTNILTSLIMKINKKPENMLDKVFLNFIKIILLILDFFFYIIVLILISVPSIVWKPSNIRLPYFKKKKK